MMDKKDVWKTENLNWELECILKKKQVDILGLQYLKARTLWMF